MMSQMGAKARYRHQSLVLAASLLGSLIMASFIVAIDATALDRFSFLGFPLGLFLAGQALLIIIAAAGFWFARVQERLDLELSNSPEL